MIWSEPRIETVQRVDFTVEPYIWPFLKDDAAHIDAHWQKLIAKKPRLFNGRVMMMFDYWIDGEAHERVLHARGFETEYKAFQAWRDFGFPDKSIMNCFSMAALRSADGAFMLGRMSDHTASAGLLYFPAGTPDQHDVKDGHIDLYGSAVRELAEETGLTPDDVSIAPDWTLVINGPRLACMKPMQARLDALGLVAHCAAFLAQDEEQELKGLFPVFSENDFDAEHMPAFVLDYMRALF
jgi:8-oxo-dGTP pyrophosphatase MutT (NUDIX family)